LPDKKDWRKIHDILRLQGFNWLANGRQLLDKDALKTKAEQSLQIVIIAV
jgi:hypothetical protein